MKDLLKEYVDYNLWANTALANLMKEVDPALLEKEIKSSYSSIRNTAFHIWDAEFIWLKRLNGESLTDFPSKTFSADTHPSRFLEGSTAFKKMVDEKENDFFKGKTEFKTLDGTPYSESNYRIIMHVMNHSSFHRGQLVAQLRNGGFEGKIPRTDLVIYQREINS